MGKKKSLLIPNFTAYLDDRHNTNPRSMTEGLQALGCFGFVGGIFGTYWTLHNVFGSTKFMAGMAAFGAAFVIGGLWQWLDTWRKKRLSRDMKWRLKVYDALDKYFELKDENKLTKKVDTVALQLMEAAAYHWFQIKTKLDGYFWNGDDVLPYYQELRAEIQSASDNAMDELAMMCAHCIGEPQKTQSSEFSALVSDLKDLKIEAVIDRAGELFSSDSPKFAHKSPHLPSVFYPAKAIAEKLQTLHAETDRIAAEAQSGHSSSVASFGAARIDVLLNNLKERRQAEVELDSETIHKLDQR